MLENNNDIERNTEISGEESPVILLQERVQSVLDAATERDRSGIVRVQVPVAGIEPLQWLGGQQHAAKIFWESRDRSFYSAAAGVADQVVASPGMTLAGVKDVLTEQLDRAVPDVRYYGGVRFDRTYPDQNGWAAFGEYSFTLPRFELIGIGDRQALCCNLVLPADRHQREGILEEIRTLRFFEHGLQGALPLPIERKDTPDEDTWHAMIADALSLIQNGHALEKVVLARKVEFLFSSQFDRFLLLNLLRDATPHCFHFYFQQGKIAFLGAPPERLYQRDGRNIESEAVAGTGPRDDLNTVDAQMGHALLLSEKDQREHAFVRKSIEQVFDVICSSMTMDAAPSLMNISIGKHLHSRAAGTLRQSVSDIDILRRLSPTSAVGGYPSQEALEIIRELESFDRGWYAGPVGWISRDAAEFAVAIRSGLASNRKLTLYSGAGIVDGSRPDAEWNEIEQKLGDFIKALGLDQRSTKY